MRGWGSYGAGWGLTFTPSAFLLRRLLAAVWEQRVLSKGDMLGP